MSEALPEQTVLHASRMRWLAYAALALVVAALTLRSDAEGQLRSTFAMIAPMIMLALVRPKPFLLAVPIWIVSVLGIIYGFRFIGPAAAGWVILAAALLTALACFLASRFNGFRLIVDRDGFEFVNFWRFRRRIRWADLKELPEMAETNYVVRVPLKHGSEIEFLQTYGLNKEGLLALLRGYYQARRA